MHNFSHFFASYSTFLLRHLREFKLLLLLVSFLSMPVLISAQTMDAPTVARKLQSTYEKASNLVADFSQTTAMKLSSRVRQGTGSMIFRKPGRMRWDYLTPDYQVLISDGEVISMYFEKSNQMIVSDAKDYLQSDVTYSFFAGTGDLLKDFDIVEADFTNNQENSHLIKLIPKSTHPHVSYIHAWVTDTTFLIQHLQIVDHFDTVTDLFFNNIQIDSDHYGTHEIKEELFFFTPPANTEIIEQY